MCGKCNDGDETSNNNVYIQSVMYIMSLLFVKYDFHHVNGSIELPLYFLCCLNFLP